VPSFAQEFENECRRLAPLYAVAEKADIDFHAGLEHGAASLGAVRYKQTDHYRHTLNRFHESTQAINKIVSVALNQAKAGSHMQLSTLFAYIAVPGRYFRSGYQRARIWRFVKRLSLDAEEASVLHDVVLHQVKVAGPEFVEIVRFAGKINSAELREDVRNVLREPQKDYVFARAKRLLCVLEANRKA
jgi:hypothetical protein